MSFTGSMLNPSIKLGLPTLGLDKTCSLSQVQLVRMSSLHTSATRRLKNNKIPRLVCNSLKYKTLGPICWFGRKGNSSSEKKVFLWDSLKDAWKDWRQQRTVQDMLQQQIQWQQEFGGNGGDGNRPNRGGDGSGGTEDEGFAGLLDETLQVVLATMALMLVYIYIIRGAELSLLGRDYMKYLLGGVPSMRLQGVMNKWKRFCDEITWTKDPPDWLEWKILNTPTWWHNPKHLGRFIESRLSNMTGEKQRPETSPG